MTRSECKRDMYIGIAFVLIGLCYILITPYQVSDESDGFENITGRSFPYLIGGVLSLLGGCLAARSMKRVSHAHDGTPIRIDPDKLRRVVTYSLAMIAYALLFTFIGYISSTLIALVFAMWFSGAKFNIAFICVAIIFPPLLYYLFHILMQIPLPDALLI